MDKLKTTHTFSIDFHKKLTSITFLFLLVPLLLGLSMQNATALTKVPLLIITEQLNETSLKKLPVPPDFLHFTFESSGPLKPNQIEKNLEINRIIYLSEVFRAAGYAPQVFLLQLRKSRSESADLTITSFLSAAHIRGIKFAIDLRTSTQPAHPYQETHKKIDDLLFTLKDFLLITATGDSGQDLNGDGVIDAATATGEFTACKNVVSVGGAENFSLTSTKRYHQFSSPPLKNERISDSRNGMAGFSGRGRTAGRIPLVVSGATAIANGNNQTLVEGTHYAAIDTLLHIVTLRDELLALHGIPAPSRALLRTFLVATTEDCQPGQYGRGRFQEILHRPDKSQGFGKLPLTRNSSYHFSTLENHKGIKNRAAWRQKFSVASPSERLMIVLDYVDKGADQLNYDLDLLIRADDGRVFQPQHRSNFRTTEFIEIPVFSRFTYQIMVKRQDHLGGLVPFSLTIRRQKP
jgi:hypothetical protein